MIPVLYSNVPLSFWGGIDPTTGIIVDQNHPLKGEKCTGKALCLPGGRGSSTGSQTMLELILNGTAPDVLILQRPDPILCTGAIVAQEFFSKSSHPNMKIPIILTSLSKAKAQNDDHYIWNILERGAIYPIPSIVLKESAHVGEKNEPSLGTGGEQSKGIFFISILQSKDSMSHPLGVHSPSSFSHGRDTRRGIYDNIVTLKLQSKHDYGHDKSCTDNYNIYDESYHSLCDVLAPRQTSLNQLQLSPDELNLLQIAESFQGSDHKYTDSNTKVLDDGVLVQASIGALDMGMNEVASVNNNVRNMNMARAIAMKTLFRIALLTEATSFIPISRAHIDACTYIGPGGLQFAQTLVRLGGRVAVPSTTNSSSVDRMRWQQLGTPSSKAIGNAACEVQDAYIQLGCIPSFSCAPYLPTSSSSDSLPPPHFGEQIAWGESNAVVYANSILGARTEKYADYMDICAAIVGKVPNIGVHTDKERLPTIIIDVSYIIRRHILPLAEAQTRTHFETKLQLGIDAFYPVLGWLCGNIARDRIPLIIGMELLLPQKHHDESFTFSSQENDKDNVTSLLSLDDLKAFCAAFGTTATVPLFHMAYVTPEANNRTKVQIFLDNIIRTHGLAESTIEVTSQQLHEAYDALNHTPASSHDTERIDLIALGNPHFSLTELRTFAKLYSAVGPKVSSTRSIVPVTITLGRDVYSQGLKLGLVQSLEEAGVQFINDTCWCMLLDGQVLPAQRDGIILTNSGKYASYGPGLTQRQLRIGSLRACAMVMRHGHYPKSAYPSWVPTAAQFSTWMRRCIK